MCRFNLLVLLLCGSILTASAQVWLGIKGGVTTTDVSLDELRIFNADDQENFRLSLKDARYGVTGGLMIQIQLGKLLIQPEFMLHSNSADFAITDVISADTTVFREKYQYLDLPLLLGVRLKPFRLHAGPVGHVYLSSITELDDLDAYSESFEKLTLGWQAGLGIDLWKFMIDFRYEGNFSKYGSHFQFFDQEYAFDQNPNRLSLTLGFRFGDINR